MKQHDNTSLISIQHYSALFADHWCIRSSVFIAATTTNMLERASAFQNKKKKVTELSSDTCGLCSVMP